MSTLIRYLNDQRVADEALLSVLSQRQPEQPMVIHYLFLLFIYSQGLIRQLRSMDREARNPSRQPLRFGKK
jgi:hypothetical protein